MNGGALPTQDDDDGVCSGDESADLDMPDVANIEVDKDSALAKLLAAASAAGMDTQAVRAELGAHLDKLVSQQWTTVTSKRARKAVTKGTQRPAGSREERRWGRYRNLGCW